MEACLGPAQREGGYARPSEPDPEGGRDFILWSKKFDWRRGGKSKIWRGEKEKGKKDAPLLSRK